jgi:hypothetical protein
MKIIKVTYTARPEFAAQNQANIQVVMGHLQQLSNAGINYNCCLCADGKTFIHTAFFKSDEEQKILNALPAFKHFQDELKASGFEAPPKQELLTLVGSSTNIFN